MMKFVLFSIVLFAKTATFASSMPNHQAGPRRGSNTTTITPRVTRCIEVLSQEGLYQVSPEAGSEIASGKACGIYLLAKHNKNVQVEVVDIHLAFDEDLVVFFDGWEMNGHTFPSRLDHHKPLVDRSAEMDSHQAKYNSSQNAAMVQYKIMPGTKFVIKVTHTTNSEPCNVLMSSLEEELTIKSPIGLVRNCTLTSMLFPAAKYRIEKIGFGAFSQHINPLLRDLICQAAGDLLIIGGSNSLESTDLLESIEVRCNDHEKIQKGFAVLCESSSVKLVSSGKFNNEVRISARQATASDFDASVNHVSLCPVGDDYYDY